MGNFSLVRGGNMIETRVLVILALIVVILVIILIDRNKKIATALGYVERNSTAPRLTELVKKGRVKEFGTKYDSISNRNVTTYELLYNAEQKTL